MIFLAGLTDGRTDKGFLEEVLADLKSNYMCGVPKQDSSLLAGKDLGNVVRRTDSRIFERDILSKNIKHLMRTYI